MSRATIASLVVMLGLAPALWAGHVETAQHELDCAEQNYRDALAHLSAAEQELQAAHAAHDHAARGFSAAIEGIRGARQSLSANDKMREQIVSNLKLAHDALAERVEIERQIRAQHDAAAAEVERVMAEARKSFEASDAYQRVSADLAAARGQVAAEEAEMRDVLWAMDDYIELAETVSQLEAQLHALRYGAEQDPERLSAASVQWMAALNELRAIEADALANDPYVRQARAYADAVERAQREMVRRFERDLPNTAQVKDAIGQRDAERAALDQVAADVKTVRDDVAAMEKQLGEVDAALAAAERSLRHAEQDADGHQRGLDEASYAIAAAEQNAHAARAGVEIARRDRDSAAVALQQAIEASRPVIVHHPAPPVVVVQPPPVVVVEERPVVIHRPVPRREVDVRVGRASPGERERDWERGGSRVYDPGPDLAQRQRDLQRREELSRREAQWQRDREQARRDEPRVVEVRREEPRREERPRTSEPAPRREVSEAPRRLEQQPRYHQTLNGQGRMVVEQMKREAEQRRATRSDSSSSGREAALSAARERERGR